MFAAIAVLISARVATAGVTWDAPPACGPVEDLAARIDAQLGRAAPPDAVTAHATVVVEPDGYRATLRLSDGRERALTGATCAEVADAIALILALAIREAPPPDPAPPVPVPPPPTPVPSPSPRRVGAPIAVDLGVEVSGDALLLPGPALGVGPALRFGRGAWSGGVAMAIRDGQIAHDGSAIATEVGLMSGDLTLCRRVRIGDACLLGTIGRMSGAAVEGGDAGTATRWWSATGVRVGGTWALGRRLAVGAGVDALVSLSRPRFVFDDGRDGYRAPAFTLRLGISLATRILTLH